MANVITAAETIEDKLTQELGFDDHFHEHHEGDKYQANFLTTYIFSTDHKVIGRQFLITGIFWALIGAAMSIILPIGQAASSPSFSRTATLIISMTVRPDGRGWPADWRRC